MFNYFKKKAIDSRTRDEVLYEFVLDEIEKNEVSKGLWAKAVATANGDNKKVDSLYLKYRVQSIKDAFSIIEIDYISMPKDDLFTYIQSELYKDVELKKEQPLLSLSEIKNILKETKVKQLNHKNAFLIKEINDISNYGYTLLSKTVVRKNGTSNIYKLKNDNEFIYVINNEEILDTFYLYKTKS